MDKEMLDIVNDLSKKPTTELALQIMELSGENLILEQQCKKQKEVIDKAIEYISNKKAIINTDVIRIFDLFEIDEQGYTNELLDILKEVE